MLDRLPTESSLPGSLQLDRMTTGEILELMNSAEAGIAEAVRRELPRIARAVDAIADALSRGGHLLYLGAGTSGRLGVLDASECPPTFGVSADLVRGIIAGGERALASASETSEDDAVAGASDLQASGFQRGDAVIGISASGRTPYVLGAVAWARGIGAVTCGISCAADSELSKAVDYPMEPAPGPEVIAGSTRLRAGTATKMVLNMISTAVMIRLGHVYGNLMVNVQPSNAKLEDRARRIVAEATGLSYERASEFLESAGRSVRTAIVMANRKISREEAEYLLKNAGGRLAEALR